MDSIEPQDNQAASANPQRKIIHVDCDSFYASVEMLDDPTLKGRPIAVGGSSDRRGVLCTCNYEARKFGVRSAMPTAHAKRLCPDLLVLPTRMSRYKEISQRIKRIMKRYSETIEPLSLDEAYIDVTGQPHFQGSATRVAEAIRKEVSQTIGITVSAGVAPNKFLAKIASDWNKPDGLFVIPPDKVDEFVLDLPVDKVFGVGKVTCAKLHQMGIETCGDVQRLPKTDLVNRFGKFGEHLYQLAHGIDNRSVKTSRIRKSLSVEHTFATDLSNLDSCIDQLPNLTEELSQRLGRLEKQPAIKNSFVKIKFHDFTTTTIECGVKEPELDTYRKLCEDAFKRGNRPVRLMGVGVRFHTQNRESLQLSLWPEQGKISANL
ncbi:MAG: DNA polymerase IV [Pseudomonadales bacterium]|nr:DNA polymerase IV [Pseudomonadales bacterium]